MHVLNFIAIQKLEQWQGQLVGMTYKDYLQELIGQNQANIIQRMCGETSGNIIPPMSVSPQILKQMAGVYFDTGLDIYRGSLGHSNSPKDSSTGRYIYFLEKSDAATSNQYNYYRSGLFCQILRDKMVLSIPHIYRELFERRNL